MSIGAFGGDDSPRPAETEEALGGREAAEPGARELLDEVLRETLSVASDSDPLKAVELQKLIDVVRRYGDEMAEAGVLDLVQCLLGMRFRGLSKNKSHWDNVAQEITRTLLEDPPSEERLRLFWRRLCEAAG
ncbi:MAG: hypothetical protein CMJ64_08870 [Planctomycetaceae bacterium]|nr:hypothetical protein [Planctomycetaceae bacterium]